MKFRQKVLLINLILLSTGLAIIGYFMIRRNYQLALNSQIKNSVEESNLIQNTLEYKLLDIATDTNNDLSLSLKTIANDISLTMTTEGSLIYIYLNDEFIYPNSEKDSENSFAELTKSNQTGSKYYTISEIDNKHFIYVMATSIYENNKIQIINKCDISDVYDMTEKQQNYFSILLLIILCVESLLMSILCYYLTKPLEKLNAVSKAFGTGDYNARAVIKSSDEVGELAKTYNLMADAVHSHVNELNAMIERQDQFIADFTHEIKTPMTSIIGYSDTIRSRELPRETEIMAASYIFNEGKRLEKMSQKLFEFIYTKNNYISFSNINSRKLMDEVCQSVMPMAQSKNIEIVINAKVATISGDIDLLKSAFINIMDNAIKASNHDSQIIFSSEIDGDFLIFSVQDFGRGIPKEHLEKICNEFYMVDKSRSRNEGGAGLGLSLAALIFDKHGAKLSIDSTENIGTTLQVSFSICPAD